MTSTDMRDALNNVGMPQLAIKVRNGIQDLNKYDMKTIVNKINEFDAYYIDGWNGCKTRNTLVDMVWDYVETFRCYSIL